MSYEPITGTFIQYQKANGGFASNYYLKFYKAGLDTAILVAPNRLAQDDDGNTLLLDKVRLNTYGSPVNPSGGDMIPHVNEAYKIALYQNADDADNDRMSNADRIIDNVAIGNIGAVADVLAYDAEDISYTATGTATPTTVEVKLQEYVSVLDFGADNTGSTSCTTEFATALLSGLNIYVPAGTYLGKFVVKTNYQSIHFQNGVTLKASATNDVMFKQVTSYSNHTGGFLVDSNGQTNVTGIQCGPEDLTETGTRSDQLRNVMPLITGDSGTENVVVIQCGPEVGGNDSTNMYNRWSQITLNGAKRGVWMKSTDPANTSATTPRYHIFDHILANGSNTNTAIHIEAGYGNTFQRISAFNVTSGVLPSSTPTAIKIDASCGVTSTANLYNIFISGDMSGNTRDLDNSVATTVVMETLKTTSNSLLTQWPRRYFEKKTYTVTGSTMRHVGGTALAAIRESNLRYSRENDKVHMGGFVVVDLNYPTATLDLEIDLPYTAASTYDGYIQDSATYRYGSTLGNGVFYPIRYELTTTNIRFVIADTPLGVWYTGTTRNYVEIHFDLTYYTT